MRNHSYENDFDLHENETACRTHFHMKGFALKLVLKLRHKRTQKWPIRPFALKSQGSIALCLIVEYTGCYTGCYLRPGIGGLQIDGL